MAYYVTTPIYYVNAEPHLGHAYTTIGADILARHMRQRGEDVFFLTGTDEHGEPVAHAAERQGLDPRELADRNVVHFKELVRELNASNDFFIRTTDEGHEAEVSRYIQELYDRGDVYAGSYEGWYCPHCADFKTEQELRDGLCPVHRVAPERKSESNYFFRLSKYQSALEELYERRPDFVLPRHRYNEALSFIRQGLNDVSISRSQLTWGIPLPWDASQVVYVWFDALLNYVSALRYGAESDVFDRYWPASVHLLAKDILKFHAVIWPAMLMAGGVEVPQRMFIHGYLLMQGEKMSKTLGNVLDPRKVVSIYGIDAVRYYLFREVSFGQDGAVSTSGFEARYNSELANEFGNLAQRTLSMVRRYVDGSVGHRLSGGPHGDRVADIGPRDPGASEHGAGPTDVRFGGLGDFSDFGGEFVREFCAHVDDVELTLALAHVWRLVRRLNQYVEEQSPWTLAKDPGAEKRLEAVLYNLVDGLRCLGVLLHSFMPQTCERLLRAIGQSAECPALESAAMGSGPDRYEIGPLEPLFPKLEA